MQISSFFLAFILVASWSIVPVLKKKQINQLDYITILLVQQVLTILLSVIIFWCFSKKSLLNECKTILNQPKEWWWISIWIAIATLLGSLVFIGLTDKKDVWFLSYAKPLSMIFTFILAAFFGSSIKWTRRKILGLVSIVIGMYLFG